MPAFTFGTKAKLPATATVTSANPATFTINCPANTGVLWLGIVVQATTARSGGAPTYNGVAMTAGIPKTNAGGTPEENAETWYMLDPPTGSALTISVPNAGAIAMAMIAATGTKESPTDVPSRIGGSAVTGSSTNPSGNSSTGATGDIVFALIGNGAQTWNPTARTGTQLYDSDAAAWGIGAQYEITASTAAVAMGWTFGTSEDWVIEPDRFTLTAGGATYNESVPAENAGTAGDSVDAVTVALSAMSEGAGTADHSQSTQLASIATVAEGAGTAQAAQSALQLLSDSVTQAHNTADALIGGMAVGDDLVQAAALDHTTSASPVYAIGVSDARSLVDATTSTQTMLASWTSSSASAESVGAQLQSIASVTSTNSGAEAVASSGQFAGNVLTAMTVADSVNAATVHTVLLAEPSSLLDSIVSLVVFIVQSSSTNTALEQVNAEQTGSSSGSVLESVGAVEQVSASQILIGGVLDVVSASDLTFAGILQAGQVVDAANAANTISSIVIFQGSVTQANVAGFDVLAQLQAVTSLQEAMSFVSVFTSSTPLDSLFDEVGIIPIDSVQSSVAHAMSVAEVAVMNDVIAAVVYGYAPTTVVERDALFQLAYLLAEHYQIVFVQVNECAQAVLVESYLQQDHSTSQEFGVVLPKSVRFVQ